MFGINKKPKVEKKDPHCMFCKSKKVQSLLTDRYAKFLPIFCIQCGKVSSGYHDEKGKVIYHIIDRG